MWDERLHKLSGADREKVLQFRDDGMTNRAIARRLNVSDATVSRILDEGRKPVKRGGWGCREGYGEL